MPSTDVSEGPFGVGLAPDLALNASLKQLLAVDSLPTQDLDAISKETLRYVLPL
jgi:hypothetical protein